MFVLGISAFYHDSAAALIRDGVILAAAQEERFSRRKHDAVFPHQAIKYCLEEAGISPDELDYVAFYDKPFLKFERLLETSLAFAPKGYRLFSKALPVWLREKLFAKSILTKEMTRLSPDCDWDDRLLFSEHHLSHAASAFYPSPFAEAAILTMDGVGEWVTTSWAIGKGNSIETRQEIHFPHSLGLLYSAFTYYAGFRVNSGEYKLMGLAPYGEPRYAELIMKHLVDVKADGSFRLDMSYFNYCSGLTMTSERFHTLFGAPPRQPESQLTQREMDLAASIQQVTEEVVLRMARAIARESGQKNLCLAGGVALNCVANGKLIKDGCFENIWVQPAAGDSGGALGAALAAYYVQSGQERTITAGDGDGMKGAYLGPAFDQHVIEERLRREGAHFQVLDEEQLLQVSVALLADGKALGWFQGRMEFGPRSLGARSILGDARSTCMQSVLNCKVKFRESFRPFAPAVLFEELTEWFDLECSSPYMLQVANVRREHCLPMAGDQRDLFGIERLNVPRSTIPAVTHVDYSARIQTVHRETNARFHALLAAFKAVTGCPVLVNTSFNVRGEPIVCTPEEAFRCFMGTGIDGMAIGNCFLLKENQNDTLRHAHAGAFKLD